MGDDINDSRVLTHWAALAERRVRSLISRLGTARGSDIIRLAFIVLGMFLLVGLVNEWHNGVGHDSVLVDIIWRVTWISYQILKVLLVGLVVLYVYRYFTGDRNRQEG